MLDVIKTELRFLVMVVNMAYGRVNILVSGILKSGSSALVDMLREYSCFGIIPGEFDDYRAPGLIADQLSNKNNQRLFNKVDNITGLRNKASIVLDGFIGGLRTGNLRKQIGCTINTLAEVKLLQELSVRLSSAESFAHKINYSNRWIKNVGDIYAKNTKYVLFNQALSPAIDIKLWRKVFSPFKLVVVYRDPRDQLADIVKFNYLGNTFGGPKVSMSGVSLETIYGRSRYGAMQCHIDALRKRYDWIYELKKELNSKEFLLVDFEGFVNNYEIYKDSIENFIGIPKTSHAKAKLYFDPEKAKKNVGIYNEYLTCEELDNLSELNEHYQSLLDLQSITKSH